MLDISKNIQIIIIVIAISISVVTIVNTVLIHMDTWVKQGIENSQKVVER